MFSNDNWQPHDDELEQERVTDDLMSAQMFFMLIIVALLVLLYSPKKETPPVGVANWPPGMALRIEARRDFALLGGPVKDGQCHTVNGVRLGAIEHFNGRKVKPEYRDLYRNRPYECSSADHDINARYITPDGKVYDIISHSQTDNADGAFSNTMPENIRAYAYGKQSDDDSYDRAIGMGAYRTEEMTYRHRHLLPGRYIINVHLQGPDNYLPEDDVLVGVFVVLFEGTPDELILFNDRTPLNARDAESREQTVVSFSVDENGRVVEGSVDYETQIVIVE